MRKTLALVAAALLLTACGGDSEGNDAAGASDEPAATAEATGGDTAGSEAFCEATREVVALGEVDAIPPEVDTMVEEAPDEIADAARTVSDTFHEAFENKDFSGIESAEFQAAAKELREYAIANCEDLRDITND